MYIHKIYQIDRCIINLPLLGLFYRFEDRNCVSFKSKNQALRQQLAKFPQLITINSNRSESPLLKIKNHGIINNLKNYTLTNVCVYGDGE